MTELVTMSLDAVPGLVWDAEVDFLFDEGIAFGLLGLDGFLNKWAVTFVAANNYFVVETVDSFEERIPVEPFEQFQARWPDPM